MNMIQAVSLCKKFNGSLVLDSLDLSIAAGEFYCLLGPNGAGKTTTLKLLTGLLAPSRGRISVGGFDMAHDAQKAKALLGFIPDTPFLYENLTAQELLEFVGSIFNVEESLLAERIEHYLQLFGLLDVRNSLLRDFSHGMRQRIIYISNFIHEPKVLLVDEPLVGLDPQAIHLIKKMLRELVKSGTTILMCTHILQIAEELADRVGILCNGKLIAEGTLGQLRDKVSDGSLEHIFLTLTTEAEQKY